VVGRAEEVDPVAGMRVRQINPEQRRTGQEQRTGQGTTSPERTINDPERLRIVPVPTTDPEAAETISRRRGTTVRELPARISLAQRKITGPHPLIGIARRIIMLRVLEQFRAPEMEPTSLIEVRRLRVRTIRTDRENHAAAKQRLVLERRITVRVLLMTKTMQARQTVETITPVVITTLNDAGFRVRPRAEPIRGSRIAVLAVQTETLALKMHPSQSPGRPEPRLRTTGLVRQKTARVLPKIAGKQHLTTGRPQKTATKRPLRRRGKLRLLGQIEPNLLHRESRGRHRHRKANPGPKPVLQATGRSVPLGQSNLDPRRAAMMGTRTTRTGIGPKTNGSELWRSTIA